VDVFSGKESKQTNASVGDVAGSVPNGRYHSIVSFDYQYFLVHRIIWEMFYGPLEDGEVIDHINGDSADNRIANLRVVSHSENMRNCKKRSDNKTGVTGVCRFINRHGKSAYTASWKELGTGKQKSKTFSTSVHGEAEAFRLACEHRSKMINALNEQGAGYTERHGK
jgi:hypothetical protein